VLLTSIAVGAVLASAAPSVTLNGACFVNARPKLGAPIAVSGSGFAPGDTVMVAATGASASASVAVGADGTFSVTIAAPTLSSPGPGSAPFTLTARDVTNGTATATVPFSVANLAFRTVPASATPSTRVRFTFSGFRPDAPIYGHYVLGRKVAATVLFGRSRGSCGLLSTRARLFPVGHARFGTYKVQFDDSRTYRGNAVPRIVSGLTIRRA
jgi:hypothetical protein